MPLISTSSYSRKGTGEEACTKFDFVINLSFPRGELSVTGLIIS